MYLKNGHKGPRSWTVFTEAQTNRGQKFWGFTPFPTQVMTSFLMEFQARQVKNHPQPPLNLTVAQRGSQGKSHGPSCTEAEPRPLTPIPGSPTATVSRLNEASPGWRECPRTAPTFRPLPPQNHQRAGQ